MNKSKKSELINNYIFKSLIKLNALFNLNIIFYKYNKINIYPKIKHKFFIINLLLLIIK